MSLPADYHMHTPLCRHAVGEPTDYAAQAVKLGFKEIGFSDHNPMIRDDYDDWHMRQDELDEYVEKVRKAQKNHPSLAIKLALEVDYLPGHEPWIRDLAARHPWDYFIGSVHYVSDAWDLDNPKRFRNGRNAILEVWTLTLSVDARGRIGLFESSATRICPRSFAFIQTDCTPSSTVSAAARSTTSPLRSTPPVCAKTARKCIPAVRLFRWPRKEVLP
jgi:histidinol-phosphatase (PHP family)